MFVYFPLFEMINVIILDSVYWHHGMYGSRWPFSWFLFCKRWGWDIKFPNQFIGAYVVCINGIWQCDQPSTIFIHQLIHQTGKNMSDLYAHHTVFRNHDSVYKIVGVHISLLWDWCSKINWAIKTRCISGSLSLRCRSKREYKGL